MAKGNRGGVILPVAAAEALLVTIDALRSERTKIIDRCRWLRKSGGDAAYTADFGDGLAAAGRSVLTDMGEPVPTTMRQDALHRAQKEKG